MNNQPTATKSFAGNVIAVLVDGKHFTTMNTYSPDTGVKSFFAFNEGIAAASFEHWERIWHAYNNEVEYRKTPLGSFTRQQVEAAGDNPVAKVVEIDYGPSKAEVKAIKAVQGTTPYGRCQEMARQGLAKADCFAALTLEFPQHNPKALKTLLHSAYATVKKKTGQIAATTQEVK